MHSKSRDGSISSTKNKGFLSFYHGSSTEMGSVEKARICKLLTVLGQDYTGDEAWYQTPAQQDSGKCYQMGKVPEEEGRKEHLDIKP